MLNFKALHQQVPTYIQDLVTCYSPLRTLRSFSTLHVCMNPSNFNQKSYGSRALLLLLLTCGTVYQTTSVHVTIFKYF